MRRTLIVLIVCLIFTASAHAWQGFNLDTGTVILVSVENGHEDMTMGNVTYFDYDTGEQKLGYLNMYEKNIGLLMDLDTGDLIRVQMEGRE